MYICFKCKEVVTLEELLNGSFGNCGSIFCPKCTEDNSKKREELKERFTEPCGMMERYIELVSSGIDPAGQMYPVYIDNNLMLKRKEVSL